MELPDILQSGRGMHGRQRRNVSTFACAVVHDCHTGMQPVDEGRGSGLVRTVVRCEEQIEGSDGIIGAHQLLFAVVGEVTKIRGFEFSKGEDDSHGLVVFNIDSGFVTIREACTGRVWFPSARERLFNDFAVRGNDDCIESC